MKKSLHLVEFLLFSAFRGILNLLPFGAAQRAGRALGAMFYRLLPGRRLVALDNLRHAFPQAADIELEALAKGAFLNFGISICEFLCFPKLRVADLRSLLHYDVNGGAFRTIGSGGGMVLVTGHFGNWELAGLGTGSLAGVPLLMVVKTQSNRFVDASINRLRCSKGNEVVAMEKSVRAGMRRLLDGGAIALAADQSAPRESEFVPFFGREVATFRGPAVFALRAGVPLYFIFVVRRADYTYDYLLEEVPSGDLGGGGTEENIRELTRRHAAILERHIRLHPDHWLWMHRRWKHLAPAAAEDGKGAPAAA